MVVFTVNASVPCVYDNNNGAKNNADLDNNEGLNNNGGLDCNSGFNNHLDIGDNFAEDFADDGVDFATRNDFDDENNCGALF
ncbi:hypothetical protein A9G39_07845 [Gilliamella sp. Imp1-6]|nr:hypothetical protein A9G39_07845 [Gilliamella apicola]